MLDRREIDIEIARLEYVESNYADYAKLANLYTIREQMDKSEVREVPVSMMYSAAPAPEPYGDTEFLQAVSEKPEKRAWLVMDELMDTLSVANPRLYATVMRKLNNL